LIPGYHKVREMALEAGACGVAISGAGPAMMAIVNSRKNCASRVAEAMKKGFESVGVSASAFCTKPGRGVSLLEVAR
jgi:homoserine kinase